MWVSVSFLYSVSEKKEYRPAKKMQNRRNFSCKKYKLHKE